MSRALFSCLITSLLWAAAPAIQALPLSPSQAPQANLGLSANQWKESAILMEAVELLKRGEPQQAKTKLAQFLKRNPNDPRGPELAGMILMAEKNYQVAVISFERALTLSPNNPGVLSKLGVCLLLQDKKKEGESMLNKAIALRAGEPLARRYLGWLDEGRGNLNGAGYHYIAALKGGDLPAGVLTEIHVSLGRIYSALGRHEQTVRLLAPYIAKADSGEIAQVARFQLAFAYIELQRGAEATPLIQRLEKELKPDNPELRFLKAYAQLDSNPTSAREKLQALIKSHPTYTGRARLLIARSYAVEGKTPLAVKELEGLAAQVEKGDLPEVLTALVALQLSAGKATEAGNVLETYAKKHPDIPEITYLLIEARIQAGDIANAQTQLKQLVSKYPNYAQAYALLGQIERSQNALPQAEEHLRKAVTLDSNLAPAWVNLAGVYVSRKDLAKAEGTLKQGLETNPGNAVLQYELANIYDAMGRGQDANPLYRTILAAYPNYLPALNNIAINLAEGNDLANARQYAEKAYQIDKRNPAVQDTYGWILILSNDTGKGLPLLEQAARGMPSDPTVLYHLGAALIKAGKAEEGKRYVQRALASGLPENLRKKAQALTN
ncbi:MAG: tetratricopeptide repeat protein [Burkholderiales bacterium]|nr:tetratricopeptide repeat protein [Burkholderiales bacterium]